MITYIEFGDIFKIKDVKNYAHGCNCSGVMGKGIALQFKRKFPAMYAQYRNLCLGGKYNLGDVFCYHYESGVVFNLATQSSWKSKADLLSIEIALNKMFLLAIEYNAKLIALPKIGAGLGRLHWDDVKPVIEKIALNYPIIDIFVVENYKASD